jgi:hypothetical protein
MAERTAKIVTIPLFKNLSLSAGDTGTSGIIDLREIAQTGTFSISSGVAAGTSTTAGTTVFTYVASPYFDGTFVAPAGVAALGTSGATIGAYFASISPVLAPFIKIVATQTGAGTAGANSKISAELHVR